jgi:hypothetical protein
MQNRSLIVVFFALVLSILGTLTIFFFKSEIFGDFTVWHVAWFVFPQLLVYIAIFVVVVSYETPALVIWGLLATAWISIVPLFLEINSNDAQRGLVIAATPLIGVPVAVIGIAVCTWRQRSKKRIKGHEGK